MYREITHIGCKCKVDENGDCFTCNGKGEFIHKNWRYNNDGYPIVSACGYNKNGEPTQRSIQVYILVAKAFVDGWFKGAEVNHKDFNRKNPSAENLEWVTHAENIHYSALAQSCARQHAIPVRMAFRRRIFLRRFHLSLTIQGGMCTPSGLTRQWRRLLPPWTFPGRMMMHWERFGHCRLS